MGENFLLVALIKVSKISFKYFLFQTETGTPKGPQRKRLNLTQNRRNEIYRAG